MQTNQQMANFNAAMMILFLNKIENKTKKHI
jgi:hypothetical protein